MLNWLLTNWLIHWSQCVIQYLASWLASVALLQSAVVPLLCSSLCPQWEQCAGGAVWPDPQREAGVPVPRLGRRHSASKGTNSSLRPGVVTLSVWSGGRLNSSSSSSTPPPPLQLLISQMLQVNVDSRFTAEEVLSHPWVTVREQTHTHRKQEVYQDNRNVIPSWLCSSFFKQISRHKGLSCFCFCLLHKFKLTEFRCSVLNLSSTDVVYVILQYLPYDGYKCSENTLQPIKKCSKRFRAKTRNKYYRIRGEFLFRVLG